MGNQTWIQSLMWCETTLRWWWVCVCMFIGSRSGCMYDLGDCICVNVPTGNAPFFFLLFFLISNLRWNLRRLSYLRSITVGYFSEGFVNCIVFLCVLWRWFAFWRGFNALAPYHGKPNLNALMWNYPEVIVCICCLMCLDQDMCMILVIAFVFLWIQL